MPLYPASAFEHWPSGEDTLRGAVFATYLDLLWVEAAADALARMLAGRRIKATSHREQELVRVIISEHPELLRRDESEPRTLRSAARLLRQRRRELERLAVASAVLDPSKLTELFPIGQIGQLGRSVALHLTQFVTECRGDQDAWQIKICFDEAECLSAFQQKVINTAVRLTTAPLGYVISYVRPMEEMTATLLPNISLQRADREVVRLDSPDADAFLDDSAFLDLVEGVSRVRIAYCRPDLQDHFSVAKILGNLNINGLLLGILQTSEDPQAEALLELSRRLDAAYSDLDIPEGADRPKAPPIYQAYIIDRLGLEPPTTDTPKARRAQDSAELRKRMVAAYLCICADLGQQVRYAYADMLLQMCDKCIRDYFSQMDEVFQEANTSLELFLAKGPSTDQQHAALRRASNKKREYVPSSGVGSPTETLRLIDALGALTARLQTTRYKERGLRSSERGMFVLDLTSASGESLRALQVVVDAADAGFLKLIKKASDEWRFRVHCSLAAAYGFSYRGAYYPVPLRVSDVSGLCAEADNDRRQDLLVRLETALGSDAAADLPLLKDLQ